jgi:hypothetical protein
MSSRARAIDFCAFAQSYSRPKAVSTMETEGDPNWLEDKMHTVSEFSRTPRELANARMGRILSIGKIYTIGLNSLHLMQK